MVAVKPVDIWAKLVLVDGRAGLVEGSVKAWGNGALEGKLVGIALVESVSRDTRLGDFASVRISSCFGVLWSLGSAV